MKKFSPITAILIIAGLSAGILYLFLGNPFGSQSESDKTDRRNDKIISMFNAQIDQQIENHTQSTMYPGYTGESRKNTVSYLKTIKTIESYARYGVQSTRPRNYLELNIAFNDGTTAKEVYTGHSCSGYTGPCLLMKVEMSDGKAVKVYTNGQEKKGSPDWIIQDLSLMIEKTIAYDMGRNRQNYFPPEKKQQDFDKEWENRR